MLPIVPASFGDIVTAVGIVHSICKALSDSTGAANDYQSLINELHYLEKALEFVHVVITAASPTASGSDARDIAAEITTCLELLNTFHDRIWPYHVLDGGKHASWFKNSCRKIGWTLTKVDEVAIFRQKISQHRQNITLFLSGLTM